MQRSSRGGSGHGTGALGPSDSSDSGSDVVGACGLAGEESLDLDSGTTSDLEAGTVGMAPPVPTSATPISTATAIRAAPANAPR
ncbi:hypothetical protein LP419_05530 [Massilia sp. H-1]|nr:hypothetical protein LP419_05530 [Massilia sp. H-1]